MKSTAGDVRRPEVVAVVGGAVLLTTSWVVVAAEGRVAGWETGVFRDVNDLPDVIWQIVRVPMQAGSLAGSLVIVAITWAVSRNRCLTGAVLLSSQVAYWSAKGVKSFVARARPGSILEGVHIREHATGLGYLSGHTAVAFALGASLVPSLPRRWQPLVAVIACSVAFSRVYAGVHLPLDAVGGAGLGLLTGTLSRWLFGLGGEGMPVKDRV